MAAEFAVTEELGVIGHAVLDVCANLEDTHDEQGGEGMWVDIDLAESYDDDGQAYAQDASPAHTGTRGTRCILVRCTMHLWHLNLFPRV